mgnify:CR=1 FL=1
MTHPKSTLSLALAAVLALGGCGGGNDETADVALEEPAEAGDDGFEAGQADDDAGTALTAAALEAVELGLASENEALRAAIDELARADTDAGKLEVLGSIDVTAIEAEAAGVAGLRAGEYARLKDAVFDRLGRIEMQAVVAGTEDPYAGLDPDTSGALKARQARLAELRAQHIGLMFKLLGS